MEKIRNAITICQAWIKEYLNVSLVVFIVLLQLIVSAQGALATEPSEKLLISTFASPTTINEYNANTGKFLGVLDPRREAKLRRAHSIRLGPDGLLYVSNYTGDKISRFEPISGLFVDTFVPMGSGGLDGPTDALHGSDGHLYVVSYLNNSVSRFDGETGEYLDEFVPPGSGGLNQPEIAAFGPSGHLYIACRTEGILQYNGVTGEFMRVFIPHGVDGVNDPHVIIFGPDGKAYVAMFGGNSVHRFDAITGEYIDQFIAPGSGGIQQPHGMAFGIDGDFYVTSFATNEIIRFDGATGKFRDVFMTTGTGGPYRPTHLLFIPMPELQLTDPKPGKIGVNNIIMATGATPGDPVHFYLAKQAGLTPIPGCTDISVLLENPKLLGVKVVNDQGVASIDGPLPPRLSGQTMLIGAISPSSCKRSNVVKFVFP